MMETKKPAFQTIDEYIATCPVEIQPRLQEIRAAIRAAAPDAQETISYSMPAFAQHGSVLVYFAAFKNHIGFYPTPNGIENFHQDLARYKSSKGTVQLPLEEPLPIDLITRIVKFRIEENQARAAAKAGKKK
jgi:uncharacterized protein YdhG (YjbR/CyaY superfamily)